MYNYHRLHYITSTHELESLTREDIATWFMYFQNVIERTVKLYKLKSTRDFATTLLFAILSRNFNIYIQIGDGIIAVGDESNLQCVFLPQNGEFLNTTHFATETNATQLFMYKTSDELVKRIAMHTDGIEQIAFDFASKKPFIPFFTPFFNAINKAENNGYNEVLSQQLGTFLQSDRVNKKTDDDKTLLLAIVNEIENKKAGEFSNSGQ